MFRREQHTLATFNSLAEIKFPEEVLAKGKENVLVHDTGSEDESRVLIFSNNSLLKILNKATILQMDGTPIPFSIQNGIMSKQSGNLKSRRFWLKLLHITIISWHRYKIFVLFWNAKQQYCTEKAAPVRRWSLGQVRNRP